VGGLVRTMMRWVAREVGLRVNESQLRGVYGRRVDVPHVVAGAASPPAYCMPPSGAGVCVTHACVKPAPALVGAPRRPPPLLRQHRALCHAAAAVPHDSWQVRSFRSAGAKKQPQLNALRPTAPRSGSAGGGKAALQVVAAALWKQLSCAPPGTRGPAPLGRPAGGAGGRAGEGGVGNRGKKYETIFLQQSD
jgi:hypothetical protein